jgi:hypothetical protein
MSWMRFRKDPQGGGGSASLAEVCGSVDQGPLPPIPLRYAPQSRRFITRCGDKWKRWMGVEKLNVSASKVTIFQEILKCGKCRPLTLIAHIFAKEERTKGWGPRWSKTWLERSPERSLVSKGTETSAVHRWENGVAREKCTFFLGMPNKKGILEVVRAPFGGH